MYLLGDVGPSPPAWECFGFPDIGIEDPGAKFGFVVTGAKANVSTVVRNEKERGQSKFGYPGSFISVIKS